jgi:hypothetical protein
VRARRLATPRGVPIGGLVRREHASCLVWSFLLPWSRAAPALGPLRGCPDNHGICPARAHSFDPVEGAFYCQRAKIGCH